MTAPQQIRLPARLEHLARFIAPVAGFARTLGLPPGRINQIELALEEALVNIFNYAYSNAPGDAHVLWRSDETGALIIEIRDWGTPFDLLKAQKPDLGADMATRKIGGLGIYMIRQLMDDVAYRYEENQNVITLTVRGQAQTDN
jgi:serine/threonine-protein kinase RsbW